MKREDNQLLVVTHLVQLVDIIFWPLGIVAALILWVTKRDEIHDMDEHGKSILNFQISLFIYALICIPLCLILVGILGLIVIGIIGFIFPIINAVNASSGKAPYYPLSLQLIK